MKRHLVTIMAFSFFSSLGLSQDDFSIPVKQGLLIDYRTGAILYEKDSHKKMVPSSMTKMMTVYLAFEGLKKERLHLEDQFSVSEEAWKMGGSRMFLEPHTKVSLEKLIHGVITLSGNDASMVVAEGISGDYKEFARAMTKKAKELGMLDTMFQNPSGWPEENHYTTAWDLSLIAKSTLTNFPDLYKKFYPHSIYSYNSITQYSENTLLREPELGVDGLKTGHTESGGFGITASAERGDQRIIFVINGMESRQQRISVAKTVISYGFREFTTKKILIGSELLGALPVLQGKSPQVSFASKEDQFVTFRKDDLDKLKVTFIPLKQEAPIAKDEVIARVVIEGSMMKKPVEMNLSATEAIDEVNIFKKVWIKAKSMISPQNNGPSQEIEKKLFEVIKGRLKTDVQVQVQAKV